MDSTILDLVHSKKESLANIIDYSTDSIVSKTIVKNNGGSSIAFAFDKGQGLTTHTSPVDALVYIIDGQATITVSGNDNSLTAGDIIIMPANAPHAVKALSKMKMMLIMLKIAE